MQAPKRTTNIRDALRAKAGIAFDTPVKVAIDSAAIAKGREPLVSRLQDVAALQKKVAELYDLKSVKPVQTIDAGFKFSAVESDAEFNYLHVEPLMERAWSLLDRCLSHRSEWDRLQVERWRSALELDQFFRLLQVEEREREAGESTLGYQRAVLETMAEQSLQENHKEAEVQLKALLNYLVESGLNKRMSARETAAWLSAYPLKDGDLHGDDAAYTFDGITRTKPEHLFDAARKEADQDAWEQVYTLVAQIYTAVAESEAARLRKESLDLHAKFAHQAIATGRERAAIARDAAWQKAYQAQAPNGILNYPERSTAMQRDFSIEFREAVACLTAAGRGLKDIYDFATPFPPEGTPAYFDSVVSWATQARNRTVQISRMEQTYVLAVSLKDLTKSQWGSGLAAAEWTFDLPDEIFAGQSCVRLRGLSVSVAGAAPKPVIPESRAERQKAQEPPPDKAEGFWSGRVSLPVKASLRSMAGAMKELDQKSLPVIYLGQITDRDSAREPQIAGAAALHNASPIGNQWKLSLSPKSTGGSPTASLRDVEIHLHLAVRG